MERDLSDVMVLDQWNGMVGVEDLIMLQDLFLI